MKKPICFLALLFVLFSCGESIRFEQAQPAGIPELSKIPKKLRGTYMEGDTIYLVIGKKTIIERSEGTISETLEEIAKDISEDDEEIIISDSSSRGFKAHYEDEKAMIQVRFDKAGNGSFEWSEEQFALGPKNIIKSKDGAYYINIFRPQDSAWILRKLVLKGDRLTTYKVDNPREIADLEAITPVKKHYKKDGDSDGWTIDPTPEVLEELFEKYGEKVKSYRKVK